MILTWLGLGEQTHGNLLQAPHEMAGHRLHRPGTGRIPGGARAAAGSVQSRQLPTVQPYSHSTRS